MTDTKDMIESTLDLNITGYRTNEDGTETLAWHEREDGTVYCNHDDKRACASCYANDERLIQDGRTRRGGRWDALNQLGGVVRRVVRKIA